MTKHENCNTYKKLAETELALFAENQKRKDVEQQRDALLSALEMCLRRLEDISHPDDLHNQNGAIYIGNSAIQQVRSKE